MGSSLIFSGTEKKKQDTVVIGSSSSVINKPKETKQEMPKEKPRILTQSQSQNPAVTIKPPMAVPKIGVKQPPTPSHLKQNSNSVMKQNPGRKNC